MQVPPWYPVLQVAQAAPFFPQAVGSLPPLQVLLAQQPTQVVGSQVVAQLPDTHLSVPLQTLQAAPPVPQAVCSVPDMH